MRHVVVPTDRCHPAPAKQSLRSLQRSAREIGLFPSRQMRMPDVPSRSISQNRKVGTEALT